MKSPKGVSHILRRAFGASTEPDYAMEVVHLASHILRRASGASTGRAVDIDGMCICRTACEAPWALRPRFSVLFEVAYRVEQPAKRLKLCGNNSTLARGSRDSTPQLHATQILHSSVARLAKGLSYSTTRSSGSFIFRASI